ncbi:MAG: hypothetical protein AAF570_04420 [Bacteroidota bacterium]
MNTAKQNHHFLKGLLIVQTIGLVIYTFITIQNEGFTVFESMVAFVQSMEWKGQFTLDFGSYLMLSALWIMWRNQFKVKFIPLAIAAGLIGIIVFAPYLLYLLQQENGDLKKVLVGDR